MNSFKSTPRFYLDTSVLGGVYDSEFDEYSGLLIQKLFQGKFIAVLSEITHKEILAAPQNVIDLYTSLPKEYMEFIHVTQESVQLAEAYILANVVRREKFNDCLHISLATILGVDALVSWNFKDIVNSRRIIGYNSVNFDLQYPSVKILSPQSILS
jgi:predicted nucleic acid-binding protein